MFAELAVATASGQRQQPAPTQFNLELSSLSNSHLFRLHG